MLARRSGIIVEQDHDSDLDSETEMRVKRVVRKERTEEERLVRKAREAASRKEEARGLGE